MGFDIGGKPIGDGHPCFIVFEAGPTHTGLERAKELALLAHQAGADAVKFQVFEPRTVDMLVADKNQMFSYKVLLDKTSGAMEEVSEPLYTILLRRAMPRDDWFSLKEYCDQLGLVFFSTALFHDDIDLLKQLGCSSVKISSADVNHYPLIEYAARSGMSVQLDTGNASLAEIERAVDLILDQGNQRIIIHNCPSGYPARLESINLRLIQTLKAMFDFPVAFSDHTPGWEMDVAAVAIGANMVEKTITMDRTTRSPEHLFSLDPASTPQFVKIIRDVEVALGGKRRRLLPKQLRDRQAVRRSMHLNQKVEKGSILTEEMVVFRRPGWGIGPDLYRNFLGMRFLRALPEGAMVTMEDLGR